MSDYTARDNACAEGADDPAYIPLKVIVHNQFASVEDAEVCFSATGPNALAEVAKRLLKVGQDPDRPIIIFRGAERAGRTTLGEAAQSQKEST